MEALIFIVVIVIIVARVLSKARLSSQHEPMQPEDMPAKREEPVKTQKAAGMEKRKAAQKAVNHQDYGKQQKHQERYKSAKPNVPPKPDRKQPFESYKKKKQSFGSASEVFREMNEKEDILAAAMENTCEVQRDNSLDALAAENLMEDVYDKMVKGPSDQMSFQRDFLAEGMDMLNRYTTLPQSGQLKDII